MDRLAPARGLLACPVCAGALSAAGPAMRCREGHSFDVARQGYLNLLGGPQPANADTPAMVAARQRFLRTGHYARIADVVARRVAHQTPIVEIGAGPGWYLARLLDAHPASRGIALDVSVAAAKAAARAHDRAASVVADVWRGLPILSGRAGAVVCIFAPRNLPEFARILTEGGLLVVVTPNPDHLAGVRERYGLLGIGDDKAKRLFADASGHFEPVGTSRIRYEADADAATVADLIAMGPNAFHGLPDIVAPDTLVVSVTVSWFRRR